jgi:hypothetical protein
MAVYMAERTRRYGMDWKEILEILEDPPCDDDVFIEK